MTKEFAINILEQYRENPTLINEIETVEEAVWLAEALDMGIQSLERQEKILSYIDRLLNQGTGKKKSLKFLKKYILEGEKNDK